jgi:dipeptidyl aminopeptidase/acylaminoacyl peptidase
VPFSYSEYVQNMTRSFADEAGAAKKEGLVMAPPLPLLAREDFDREMAKSKGITCSAIVYASDGLKVKGFLWRPTTQSDQRLPLIIFLRGGNREFGKVGPWAAVHRLVSDGFIVMAPQYRGVDGGEGHEEFGGADVNDIKNLVPLAESLGYVDTNNIFLFGGSRGGMMAFLAVKRGMAVNAVAVVGALLDLTAEAKRRPNLVKNVWSQLMVGFAERPDELMRDRSPMYWPEQINVPSLVLHGGADWRASPLESLEFVKRLQENGKVVEMVLYAGDDHGLTGNVSDRNARIVKWFRRHMK